MDVEYQANVVFAERSRLRKPGRVVVKHFCDWPSCCNEGRPCPQLLSSIEARGRSWFLVEGALHLAGAVFLSSGVAD